MSTQEESTALVQAREHITAAYVLYNGSVEQDEPAAMLAFYRDLTTEDFVECNKPGDPATTATKAQMLGTLIPLVEASKRFGYDVTFRVTTVIEELRLEGSKVLATLTHYFHIVERNRTDPDSWQETWIPTSDGWRLERKQRLTVVPLR